MTIQLNSDEWSERSMDLLMDILGLDAVEGDFEPVESVIAETETDEDEQPTWSVYCAGDFYEFDSDGPGGRAA